MDAEAERETRLQTEEAKKAYWKCQALQTGLGAALSLRRWILIKGRLNMLLACSEAKLYRTPVTPALSA